MIGGHGFRRRAGLAVCSALVVLASGLGWWQTRGVSEADVIDPIAAGRTADQNILVVGLDTRTDAHGRPLPPALLAALHAGSSDDGGDNTDTVIVVHVPAGGGQATAISIPRDAYVRLADGYGTHKINSAYTYGENAARSSLAARGVADPDLTVEAAAAGARTTVRTVSDLIGQPITHYAAVNLAAFAAVSQAVGGVPVCLLAPVNDTFSGARFPVGPQSLAGPAALAFVRQRHGLPGGDLDRIRRQQVFLASMSRTVLSAGTLTDPSRLSNLLDAVRQNVTLDQGWDLVPFAGELAGLHADSITFRTVPVVGDALDTPDDGEAVEVDPSQVRGFVASVFDPPPPVGGPAPAPITVDVRNGTGRAGLAASTMAALTHAGLAAGRIADSPRTPVTTVRSPPGGEAAADAVARRFTPPPAVVADPAVPVGHVAVELGTDASRVSGPSAHEPAPGPAQPVSPPVSASAVPCVN